MHSLLERQLRKHLGDVPEGLRGLLAAVDEAYQAADADRQMLDRAMELASDELIERNRELQEANERLKRVDEERRNFINTAAHELGTPLTPLKIQIHSLRMRARPEDVAAVEMLERNVDRIIMLVGDLLDSAKLQSGHMKMRLATFDAAQMVAAAVASHSPLARTRDVHIRFEDSEPAFIHMDEGRFHQVIDNLLMNAIKFSEPEGRIRVRVEGEEDVRIQVEDEGVGIDPRRLGDLFKPFSQLQDAGSEHGGTGLGLYICKGIVEASGGSIAAKSHGKGRGATFTITLPSAADESGVPEVEAAQA